MKRLFVFFGAACALLGAGLAVPRPALAIPPADCPMVFSGPFGGNSLIIYQIDEITGPAATPEGNACFIENQNFGVPPANPPVEIDLLEQGQDRFNPSDPNPVSDYIDLVFEANRNCTIFPQPCTSVTMQSDPGATGVERGLVSRCTSPHDPVPDCVRFLELANGQAMDPENSTPTPYGQIACSAPDSITGVISCLNIVSDAEGTEATVPEPSSALLLGTVLPGLFGFRRLSRRDR